MSGILNWMIEGYRLLQAEGLTIPAKVRAAISAYRQETDIFGQFLFEYTIGEDGARTPTSALYSHHGR